jgi:hypothetical protein
MAIDVNISVLPSPVIFVVADRRGVDDANALVASLLPARVVEETCAIAQKHGHDVDIHLVNQAGLQVLLGQGGAAAQGDVFAPPRVLGPLKRCLDALGDEVEGRAALHFERIAGVMRKDEDGHVEGRILSPPAIPGTVPPRTVVGAKHVAAHDGRPDVLEVFRSDVVVGTSRTAFHAMDRAESPRGEGPVVRRPRQAGG